MFSIASRHGVLHFIVNGMGGLGGDTWSEFAYMVNYLNASLEDADELGADDSSFWGEVSRISCSVRPVEIV